MAEETTPSTAESKLPVEPVGIPKMSMFEWTVDPDDIAEALLGKTRELPIPYREKKKQGAKK